MLPISTFPKRKCQIIISIISIIRLIRNSLASDLLFDSFSLRVPFESIEKTYKHYEKDRPDAKEGVRGCDSPPEPVSVGKCAISIGKIVKFPWGVYAK